jgi:hypothetical protein
LREEPTVDGLGVGVLSGLAYCGYDEASVLTRLRELVFGFEREIAGRAGKRRWAEKTAFDVFHLESIERLLGDTCRFVCVFRHGLDVVCSLKELCDGMDRYLGEVHTYVQRYPSPYEAFAHAWVDANASLLAFMARHPDACVRVRYEDLVETPAPVLGRIFDFLDEPTDVAAVIEGALEQTADFGLGDWKAYQRKTLDRSSMNRWSQLSKSTISRLGTIINPMLETAGYEPVPVRDEVSGDTARHRYSMSLMVGRMQEDRGK